MPTSLFHSLSVRLGLFSWAALLAALCLAVTLHYLRQDLTTPASIPTSKPQHLTAPFAVIPYVDHLVSAETVTDKNGESKVISKDIYTDHTAVLLPDELNIRANLNADQTGVITLSGKMDYQALINPNNTDNQRNIRWDKAQLLIGVSDLAALQGEVKVFWDEDFMELQADTLALPNLGTGFHINLPETKETATQRHHSFEIQLPIRLGSQLTFTPTGKITKVEALFPSTLNTAVSGTLGPNSTKNTTPALLQWQWSVPQFIRGYPAYWIQDEVKPFDLHQAAFGMEFKPKAASSTNYWEIALQWAWLVLALVLGIGLALEFITGRALHWLHYWSMGSTVSLFYLLLKAGQAFWPWLLAFQISAGAVTGFLVVLVAIIQGIRSALLASLLLVASFFTLYTLTTLPAYGLLSLVGLSSLVILLVVIGSVHFTQKRVVPSPEIESHNSFDE